MSDKTHHEHTEAYRRGDHSPEALENEINAERGRVADTLDALQERMTVGGIADEMYRNFGHYGADIGRNLGRTVANNPLPLILTGVGLAWLIFSSGRDRGRPYDDDYLWDVDDGYEEDFVGMRRYGTARARPYGTAAVAGTYGSRNDGRPSTTDRVRGAAGSIADRAGQAAGSVSQGASDAAHRTGDAAHSAVDSVRGAASSATHSAGHAAGAAYDSARGAAGSAYGTARDAAGSAAGGVSHAASSAAGGVSHAASSAAEGVSHAAGAAYGSASHAARYAADTASEYAYAARRHAAYYGSSTWRRLDNMLEEQPLVMGALALAAGAAIGGALPRTRTEDEYMGEYSDEAWENARDMAMSEAEKARRVAGAVYDEARHIADEKAGELSGHAHDLAERAKAEASQAADRLRETASREAGGAADKTKAEAKDATNRLSETAKEEAKKQDLGNPNKPA